MNEGWSGKGGWRVFGVVQVPAGGANREPSRAESPPASGKLTSQVGSCYCSHLRLSPPLHLNITSTSPLQPPTNLTLLRSFTTHPSPQPQLSPHITCWLAAKHHFSFRPSDFYPKTYQPSSGRSVAADPQHPSSITTPHPPPPTKCSTPTKSSRSANTALRPSGKPRSYTLFLSFLTLPQARCNHRHL